MLPRKGWLLSAACLLLVRSTQQYSSGAPANACIDQTPRHGDFQPQSSVPPYVVTVAAAQVRQGDTVTVTITSPGGTATPVGGFILQARKVQNPSEIVGQFVSVPDPSMQQIKSCAGENDTVTHTSQDEKRAMAFEWRAPTDFLGGVGFRATVAQSYTTFWLNVASTVLEVVTPETLFTTAQTPASDRTTLAPPVIMESKPKPTPKPLDAIYQGCSENKLCFGSPQGCVETGTCKAVVAVFVAGNTYTFEIQGSGNPKYVAAGLSADSKMGDDSAMECVRNDNGRVALYTSWTYPKAEPYVSRSDSPQNIVQLQESSVIDGKLYCKFVRDTVSTVKGQTFDLAEGRFNLMIVAGEDMKDKDRVGFHGVAYEATGAPLALSSAGAVAGASKLLLKLHGSFMLAAWLGSAALGILLARYFRQTWVGKQLGGKDIWFAYHRILMALTWLLTVAGFVLILFEVGGITTTGDNPHAITGLVTVVLCFLQPIGAYFRPHPGTKRRAIFNWGHWLGGNSAHILGIATIFLAVYLQKAELPSWSIYVLAAYVAFHVVMHLVLSLTICVSDGRISNGRVNSFPMKDMLGHTRHATQVDRGVDAPYSSFRRLLLSIYVAIVVLFTVAMVCLVALAPITQTYGSIMGA